MIPVSPWIHSHTNLDLTVTAVRSIIHTCTCSFRNSAAASTRASSKLTPLYAVVPATLCTNACTDPVTPLDVVDVFGLHEGPAQCTIIKEH